MEEIIAKLTENLHIGAYENSTNGQALLEHDLNELTEAWLYRKCEIEKALGILDGVVADDT